MGHRGETGDWPKMSRPKYILNAFFLVMGDNFRLMHKSSAKDFFCLVNQKKRKKVVGSIHFTPIIPGLLKGIIHGAILKILKSSDLMGHLEEGHRKVGCQRCLFMDAIAVQVRVKKSITYGAK